MTSVKYVLDAEIGTRIAGIAISSIFPSYKDFGHFNYIVHPYLAYYRLSGKDCISRSEICKYL